MKREIGGIALVVDTEVFVDFATWRTIIVRVLPLDIPTAAPGARIGALVTDRHFVFQRVEIGACEAFGEVHVTGVRRPASDKPEFLIVSNRIDDQGFSL